VAMRFFPAACVRAACRLYVPAAGVLLFALFNPLPVSAADEQQVPGIVTAQGPCEAWVDRQSGAPRLRAHLDAFVPCVITEPVYRQLILDAVGEAGGEQAAPVTVALGRLEDYPWLAQALADAAGDDAAWNARRGKPRNGNANDAVEQMLLSEPLRTRLQPSGWELAGVSVEKVRVASVGLAHAGSPSRQARVPVDAQVWLKLVPVAR
jgi:hypothetical protein